VPSYVANVSLWYLGTATPSGSAAEGTAGGRVNRWDVGVVKYGRPSEGNTGCGDSEGGKTIWLIGTPPDGGCGRGAAPGGPVGVIGTDICGVNEADSEATETSEITGDEEAGRAGTPPKPGNPNCVKAGCPSIAERRAAWFARCWFIAVICSCMLVRADVKALRASATDEMAGGGDDEASTAPNVVTRGRVAAAVTPTVGTPIVGVTIVGGTGAEDSPDVAIVSDTKLVERQALDRRK
jgi:hypothetical protein